MYILFYQMQLFLKHPQKQELGVLHAGSYDVRRMLNSQCAQISLHCFISAHASTSGMEHGDELLRPQ